MQRIGFYRCPQSKIEGDRIESFDRDTGRNRIAHCGFTPGGSTGVACRLYVACL
jgi:hypothetical protein